MDSYNPACGGPKIIPLLKGQRLMWCACGMSDDLPYCDSSHDMSNVKPLRYLVEEEGRYAICMCQGTGNAPFCDGHHGKDGENGGVGEGGREI